MGCVRICLLQEQFEEYDWDNNIGAMGWLDLTWPVDQSGQTSPSAHLAQYGPFKLSGAAVNWRSKKQSCVALSTAEAEYMALAIAAQEAVWMQRLQKYGPKWMLQVTWLLSCWVMDCSAIRILSSKIMSNHPRPTSGLMRWGRSYPSAEMLQAYSTASPNRALFNYNTSPLKTSLKVTSVSDEIIILTVIVWVHGLFSLSVTLANVTLPGIQDSKAQC